MLLYRVKVSYKDVYEYQKWEKKIAETRALDDTPPLPDRKIAERFVAVWPEIGENPVTVAARTALNAIIGEPETWDGWEACVESIERVGDVILAQNLKVLENG